MLPENLETIFGCYKNGQYDHNSVIFGKFDVKKFITSINEEPPNLDTAIPGVYETSGKVFLNMVQTLTQFPNTFRGVQGGEPIHTLKALVGLGQCGKSTACHSSFVKTKNEGVLQSKCIKQNWSSYDIENETAHMSHFIFNMFENCLSKQYSSI